MLSKRLLWGTVMIILAVFLLLLDGFLDGSIAGKQYVPFGSPVLWILLVAVAFGCLLEFAQIVKSADARIFLPVTLAAIVIIATLPVWGQFFVNLQGSSEALIWIFTFSLLGIFGFQAVFYRTQNAVKNLSVNGFAIFYIGFFLYFLQLLRIEYGPWALLMVVLVVKMSDIGAYAAGKLWGKTPFSPKISPAKTWEGMAGAVILAIASGSIIAAVFDIMALWVAVLFGVVFAFVGQAGDLVESMIKRDVQIKDSSNTVPGFGGLLDVVDSLVIAAPVGLLWFKCFL